MDLKLTYISYMIYILASAVFAAITYAPTIPAS